MDVKNQSSDPTAAHSPQRRMAPEVQSFLEPPEGDDDLIEKGDRHRTGHAKRTGGGLRVGRNLGLLTLLAGIAVTLHAYWTIANAVLATGSAPQLWVILGPIEMMQATLGLYLIVLGGIASIVLGFPLLGDRPAGSRNRWDHESSQLTYLRISQKRNNFSRWAGFSILLFGALLAGFGLREIAHSGHPGVLVDGVAYRVHFVGYILMAFGSAIFAWTGIRRIAMVHEIKALSKTPEPSPKPIARRQPEVHRPARPIDDDPWMAAPLTREEREQAMYEYGEDYDVPDPAVRG